MDEYIERKAAIRCVANQCVDGKMWGNEETEGTLVDAYELMDDLSDIPAADVAPVRHGHWIDGFIPNSMLCGCSECGFTCGAHSFLYCPACGARMDGKDGDDNAVD